MARLLRHWPWVALVVSAAMLAIAHAFETFGHLPPCNLCLKQREVYWMALGVSAAAVVLSFTPLKARASRLAALILAAIFLYGCYLAGWHAGAEWGWWPGPPSCSGGAGGVASGDLEALLKGDKIKMPECDKALWVFLGLSMAGWNFLVSVGLTLMSVLAASRRPVAA